MPETTWTVIIAPSALKALGGLPAEEHRRIEKAVKGLRAGPRAGGGKPLHGRPQWSLRVGGWRILFRVDEGTRTIFVTAVGARGDVYKKP